MIHLEVLPQGNLEGVSVPLHNYFVFYCLVEALFILISPLLIGILAISKLCSLRNAAVKNVINIAFYMCVSVSVS